MTRVRTSSILPQPQRVSRRRGRLVASPARAQFRTAAVATPRLERAFARTGDALATAAPECGVDVVVTCRRASTHYPALGHDESYALAVDGHGVRIDAPEEWGVLRALASLAQLGRRVGARLTFACCEIVDAPRFGWRGLMLDPARHFLPVQVLTETLDGMALAKLNVLHLHLSDDQGFRFESIRFPRLGRIGGDGQFYSQAELRQLVEHAADRGIRVVPELDVPGHCTSWLAAYPEWGARAAKLEPSRRFGVHEACLDPTRDDVYAALDEIFSEVAAVFPDRCVHIGGDEVNPTWWRESEPIAAFAGARGLSGAADLQKHFNRRLGMQLDAQHRTLVGWDEIVAAGLPKGAIVQSWRGARSRDRALAAGFDCVLSAGYYLDLFYPADLHYAFDPDASPDDLARAESALANDPRLAHVKGGLGWMTEFNAKAERAREDAAIGAGLRGRVLGGEACVWAELVDANVLALRIWDRLPAIAERLWSAVDVDDVDDLYRRTAAFLGALARATGIDIEARRGALRAALGLTTRQQRALAPLLDALEPIKWYARLLGPGALAARIEGRERGAARPYTVDSKLDRIVDTLAAESPVARRVATLVARARGGDPRAAKQLLGIARRWRAQAPVFERLVPHVPALEELAPLSVMLAELGDAVLAALEHRAGAADVERARRALEPSGELLLGVAPAVVDLLSAA